MILLSCFVLGVAVVVGCGGNRGDTLQSAANLAVPTALAQDNGGAKGCSIIGSWMTNATPTPLPNPNIPWLATVDGQSSQSGTIVTMVPLWPVDLPEGVIKVTDLRGNWERTGGNTFKFTQIGWGLNELGIALVVFRNNGITTLLEDCSLMKVESTMEALTPDLLNPAPGPLPVATITPMFANRIVILPPVPNAPFPPAP